MLFRRLLACAPALLLCFACSDATEEEAPEAAAEGEGYSYGSCPSGKCDGLADTVRDLYSDMRDLSLEDMVTLAVPIATEQLNDALGGLPYADIELAPTEFYGEPRELFDQVLVQDLAGLHAGLTERLGERAFATEVTRMRQATLAQRPGAVFGESNFSISGSLNHSWSMDMGDAVGEVGFFGSPTVEAIVIAPYQDNLEAAWRAPLEAVKAFRGFVLPKDLGDVRAMAPGSSVALRGTGALGFNLGVGLPITVGVIADYVTLAARVHAGARVAFNGELDVQLVRGDADDAWVDVGVTRQSTKHFELAVRTGWGIEGLPSLDLELGPVSVDLGDIAEKALEKHLNEKLSVFSASGSRGNQESRVTVARFRFDLKGGLEVERALHQALRGDIRLAQSLANRGAGVEQPLDLTRDSRSESRYLGFRFLSMRFFRSSNFETGTVHIDTDEGSQTLLFSELEQASGFFWTSRDSTWRQLTSLKASGGELVGAELNARLTLRERDSFLTKDEMLDHVDPLLAWMLGQEHTFLRIGEAADALFEFADHHCPTPENDDSRRDEQQYEACRDGLTTHPDYVALQAEAAKRFGDASAAQGFDPRFLDSEGVAQALFDLRLGLSGVHDRPDVGLNDPRGTMVTQVRFSDPALRSLLLEQGGEGFRQAVNDTLRLMQVNRDDDLDDKVDEMAKFIRRRESDVDPMVRAFEDAAARFGQLENVAGLNISGDTVGRHGALMLVPVSDPQDVRMASVAEHQGKVLGELFPTLLQKAGWLREPKAFVVGYSLIRMSAPEHVELLCDYKFEEDHRGGYADFDTRIYARGTSPFVEAGLFEIDELLGQ